MYIHNTTFFIDHSAEEKFLAWLRTQVEKTGFFQSGVSPRLSRLLAPPEEGQPLGIAMQVEFADIDGALQWRESELMPLVDAFEKHFAPEALSYSSVFETIPLGMERE